MIERRICSQPVQRESTERGEIQDPETGEWQTTYVKRMGWARCGSDKWGHDIEVSYLVPTGSGGSVMRTYKERTDRPVCGNGHIMGAD